MLTSPDPAFEDLLSDLQEAANLLPEKEAQSRRLFLLYCRKELVDLVTGDYWPKFSAQYGDEKESKDQAFTHLRAMWDDTTGDIEDIEAQLVSASGYAIGQLCNQNTVRGCPGWPNPNDPAYGGDPIRRTGEIEGLPIL
jgi:hypothetical protein